MQYLVALAVSTLVGSAFGFVYTDILIDMQMNVSHFTALRVVMMLTSGATAGVVGTGMFVFTRAGRARAGQWRKNQILEYIRSRQKQLSTGSGAMTSDEYVQVDSEYRNLLQEIQDL